MTPAGDPRAHALARYLRDRAADFSLSADVNDQQRTADRGMALLDAAQVAETLQSDDMRLLALSDAGRFEAMSDGTVVFLEDREIRAVIQRPLAGEPMSGADILRLLVHTATP